MARKPSKSELFIIHNFKQVAKDAAEAQAAVSQSSRELEDSLKQALDIQPETLAAVGNIKAMDAQVRVLARSMGATVGQVKRALKEMGEEQPEVPRDFVGALATGLEEVQEGAEETGDSLEGLATKLVDLVAPGTVEYVKEAHGAIEGVGAVAGTSAGALGVMTLAAGALAVSLGGLALLIDQVNDKVIRQQVEAEKLSRVTGLSATAIGAMGTMAEFAGVELDRVHDALTDWPEKLDAARSGTGDAAEAIGHLVNQNQNAEAAFRDVFAALQSETDEAKRTALAMKALGDEAGKTFAKLAAGGVSLEQAIAFQSEFLQANQEVIQGLEDTARKLPAIRIAFTSVLSDLLDEVSQAIPQDTVFDALNDAILGGAQGIVTVGSFVIDAAKTYVGVVERNYEILGDSFLGLADSATTGMAAIRAAASGDLQEARRLAEETAGHLDRVFVVDEIGENLGLGVTNLADAFENAAEKGERFRNGLEGLIGELGGEGGRGLQEQSDETKKALEKLVGQMDDLRDSFSGRIEAIGLDSIEQEALRNTAAINELAEALNELQLSPQLRAALEEQLGLLNEQVTTLAQLQTQEQARVDLASIVEELEGRRLSAAQQAAQVYEEQRASLAGIAADLEGTAEQEEALAALAELDRTYQAERTAARLAASLEVAQILGREQDLIEASYASQQASLDQALDDQLLSWAEYNAAVVALAEQQSQAVTAAQLDTVAGTADVFAAIASDTSTLLVNLAGDAEDANTRFAGAARIAALAQIYFSAAQAAAQTFQGTTATLGPLLGPAVVPVATVSAAAAGAATLSSALPLLQSFARGTSSFRPNAPDAGYAELHKDEGVVSRVGKQSISDDDIRAANRGENTRAPSVLQLLLRGRVVDEQIYDAQRRPGSPIAQMSSTKRGRRAE